MAHACFSLYRHSIAPVGGEFQVNFYTSSYQERPSVACANDGSFVITWDNLSGGANGYDVVSRQFNTAGQPIANEAIVPSSGANSQSFSNVAMNGDGDYVIAYGGLTPNLDNLSDIYVQRFNNSGVKQGAEFQVNTTTSAEQDFPVVAIDDSKRFVAVWSSFDIFNDESYAVYWRRYGATGLPLSLQAQIDPDPAKYPFNPSIAMDSDGDFVIVWQAKTAVNGVFQSDVYAQCFTSLGLKDGAMFKVNTYDVGEQFRPDVAMTGDGDFVIVWEGTSHDAAGSGYDIYARRYTSNGTPVGVEFRVNTTFTANDQETAKVAVDNAGNLIVVWHSTGSTTTTEGIFAQYYDSNNTPRGDNFQINTYKTDAQENPAVAMNDSNEIVIAWQSNGQDGDQNGIYAQRYNASWNVGTSQPIQAAENIRLFPNPAQQQVKVVVPASLQGERMAIYDTKGQKCLEISTLVGVSEYSIDLDTLPAGLYMVTVGPGTLKFSKE